MKNRSPKTRRGTKRKAGGGNEALGREVAALRREVGSLHRQLARIEAALAVRLEEHTAARKEGAAAQDAEVFFRELLQAHERRATPLGTAPIPELRRDVCQALRMTPPAFDEALIQCWLKGLVSLEAGNPIGQAAEDHLGYRGKKYYYVRLP